MASGFSHTTWRPAARICSDLRMVEVVRRGDVHDLDPLVGQQVGEAVVGLRHADAARALAAPRSGDEPRRPWTWTPRRRRASMWTVPMKPLPITAAPISLGCLIVAAMPLSRRLDGLRRNRSGLLGGNCTD